MAQANIERLFDEHAQALFAFLLSLTRHEADTRDLLQELFVKLANRPELLDGVRDERAFLLRLAHGQYPKTLEALVPQAPIAAAVAEGPQACHVQAWDLNVN